MEKLELDESGKYESDKWYYNSEKANIQEIETKTLNKIFLGFRFFSAFLEGYYSYHLKSSRCLLLYNKENNNLKVIDPIWYDGISSDLIKLFINFQFKSESELQNFVFELQDLLLIGSKHNKYFNNTIFSKSKVTFDLIDIYKEERLWRNIEIQIQNNTLISLKSTNPMTKESIIIR